jgi:hypothetical protein
MAETAAHLVEQVIPFNPQRKFLNKTTIHKLPFAARSW